MAKKSLSVPAKTKTVPLAIKSFDHPLGGDSAQSFKSFIPIRRELVVLAIHYFNELQASAYNCVFFESGAEWKFDLFVSERLAKIEKLLGKETIDAVLAEDVAKWGERFRLLRERMNNKSLRSRDLARLARLFAQGPNAPSKKAPWERA